MLQKRILELLVGLFMLAGILAVFFLAFKVSGLSQYSARDSFQVSAIFDNIGDLKVSKIVIDSNDFKAKVELRIDKRQNNLPEDTTAKILTAGLIGANYIELIPGYEAANLKEGDVIVDTQPAIILENLIGQLIYRLGNGKK